MQRRSFVQHVFGHLALSWLLPWRTEREAESSLTPAPEEAARRAERRDWFTVRRIVTPDQFGAVDFVYSRIGYANAEEFMGRPVGAVVLQSVILAHEGWCLPGLGEGKRWVASYTFVHTRFWWRGTIDGWSDFERLLVGE